MPKNTGGRRASARSAAFRPGGNSSTNHKPLFDMNVMSLHARKNVNAAAVNAAKVTKTTNTIYLYANGSSAYNMLHSESYEMSANNPTLSLRRGQTYIFENKSGAHPFQISDTNADDSTPYNSALETNGVLTFIVPADAPSTLYYKCTTAGHYDNGMNGTINIIN